MPIFRNCEANCNGNKGPISKVTIFLNRDSRESSGGEGDRSCLNLFLPSLKILHCVLQTEYNPLIHPILLTLAFCVRKVDQLDSVSRRSGTFVSLIREC